MMRWILALVALLGVGVAYALCGAGSAGASSPPALIKPAPPPLAAPPANAIELARRARTSSPYTLLAWNDLGMHCISPRFAEMAILPPYNNIRALVIQKGGEQPVIVTSGVTVSYAIDNNTTGRRKTDFWTYAPKLFGVNLRPWYGLAGFALSGNMKAANGRFEATGVPVLPYNDQLVFNPYQPATITLKDASGKVLNQVHIVVPVSDEQNCAKCHATGQVAARNIATPTVEGNILTLHDQKFRTNLMANRPVLCASCHSDNALGTAGVRRVTSLSYAMHVFHSTVASPPQCYDCHPGQRTQCNRSAITGMSPTRRGPNCQACHGDLKSGMAASLQAGRQPWLQEPNCRMCHGRTYRTGSTLYKEAKGHGGVQCIACHNSTHAWFPSSLPADNAEPLALQGSSRAIGYYSCYLCHTDGRTGAMPPHEGEGAEGGDGG